ncbi:MAG: hypothetical protein RIS94_971 [Pseudomonadota bacterium]|jgi:hypothetical protein
MTDQTTAREGHTMLAWERPAILRMAAADAEAVKPGVHADGKSGLARKS